MAGRLTAIEKLVWPIMVNAKQVKDNIGVYEAIGLHARALNSSQHKNFFGIIQKSALQLAVLGIAKIYDDTSKQYRKHTVYELERHFIKHVSKASLRSYSDDLLSSLNISKLLAHKLMHGEKIERRLEYKSAQIFLSESVPRKSTNVSLRKIIEHRHKFVSHQEFLTKVQKKTYGQLPNLKEFLRLAEFAENYTSFVAASFTNLAFQPHSSPSGKMATLNMIKKALDINFDMKTNEGYKAYKDFYGLKN
jgi:hypothetical protein